MGMLVEFRIATKLYKRKSKEQTPSRKCLKRCNQKLKNSKKSKMK